MKARKSEILKIAFSMQSHITCRRISLVNIECICPGILGLPIYSLWFFVVKDARSHFWLKYSIAKVMSIGKALEHCHDSFALEQTCTYIKVLWSAHDPHATTGKIINTNFLLTTGV